MLSGSGPVTDAVTAADSALERSAAMAEAGQTRAALANSRQAVALYRKVAADQPAVYEPDLAAALGVLSERLAESDDGAAALDAAEESKQIFERLAFGPDPEADLFRPFLGAATGTWAQRLHDLGRDEEALAAARATVALFDELPMEDRQRHHAALDRTRVLRLTLAPDEKH